MLFPLISPLFIENMFHKPHWIPESLCSPIFSLCIYAYFKVYKLGTLREQYKSGHINNIYSRYMNVNLLLNYSCL